MKKQTQLILIALILVLAFLTTSNAQVERLEPIFIEQQTQVEEFFNGPTIEARFFDSIRYELDTVLVSGVYRAKRKLRTFDGVAVTYGPYARVFIKWQEITNNVNSIQLRAWRRKL